MVYCILVSTSKYVACTMEGLSCSMKMSIPCFSRCASKVAPEACPPKTYSDKGQTTCSDCPLGHYCPQNKTANPIPCPTGSYANTTGNEVCAQCEAGFQCANASLTPVECESGFYSNGSRSECLQCPAGYK